MAGCGHQGNEAANVPAQPKWQGAPYHLALGDQAMKPNPVGVTLPEIKYTANPDAVERRASLVVRFDASEVKRDQPVMDQMIMAPVDIAGAEGALPADYMDAADQGLAKLLTAYGMKGKIKVKVLLARSSISSHAGDEEINSKRLSDWLPIDLDYKGSHRGR